MFDKRYLQYIKAIAVCKSISEAAQKLHISQPSLSRFLRQTEEDFGVILFDRNTIPLTITPAGKKYLRYVEKIDSLESMMREDLGYDKNQPHTLSVGTFPFMGSYVLPKIIPMFSAVYPEFNLNIQELSGKSLIKALEQGEIDIALTNLRPRKKRFSHHVLMDDEIFLVADYDERMRKLFPGCGDNMDAAIPVDWSLFEQSRLIVLRPWQNMRIAANLLCDYFHFKPYAREEVPSIATALSLVGSGKGITFVCRSHVACVPSSRPLIYFSLGEIATRMCIVAVYKKTCNPLIKKFCDVAVTALAK